MIPPEFPQQAAQSAMMSKLTGAAWITAGVAAVAAGWNYSRAFFHWAASLFIGTAILDGKTGEAVQFFCSPERMKRWRIGTRYFGGIESYVHPKRWTEVVGYEGTTTEPFLCFYNKHPMLVNLYNGPISNGNYDGDQKIQIRYFRWFFDCDRFAVEAIEAFNTRQRTIKNGGGEAAPTRRFSITRCTGSKFNFMDGGQKDSKSDSVMPHKIHSVSGVESMIMSGVFRLLKWKCDDLKQKPEGGDTPFTGYPFPPSVQDAIKEIDMWLKHEKWFRSKSIPWRRGFLLHGQPGSGKTTLVRALAMSFDLPIFAMDLSGMGNDDFVRSWEQALSSTPCIVLIEDIDNVFHGREFVGPDVMGKGHITFDCLLNCISGVKSADGVFTVITTNKLEHLDEAIGIPNKNGRSTRPGRLDRVIELGLMRKEERAILANHILSDCPSKIAATVKAGEGETAAQFQSRCADIAQAEFWSKAN